MPTTSQVTVKTEVTGTGGHSVVTHTQKNTTGVRYAIETTFGAGVANATTFSSPPNAKFMTIILPTSNESGWRLSISTAEVGLPMASQGASNLCLQDTTAGTTFYAYSTSTRAITKVRLLFT